MLVFKTLSVEGSLTEISTSALPCAYLPQEFTDATLHHYFREKNKEDGANTIDILDRMYLPHLLNDIVSYRKFG